MVLHSADAISGIACVKCVKHDPQSCPIPCHVRVSFVYLPTCHVACQIRVEPCSTRMCIAGVFASAVFGPELKRNDMKLRDLNENVLLNRDEWRRRIHVLDSTLCNSGNWKFLDSENGIHYVQGHIIFHEKSDDEHGADVVQMRVQGVYMVNVPCEHFFHSHCLHRWMDSKCPTCRSRLPAP